MTDEPAERFSQLSLDAQRALTSVRPETWEFIANLRKDDVALLAESINFMRSTKTMSRFVKGTFVVVFGTVLAIGSMMKGWQIMFEWIRTLK